MGTTKSLRNVWSHHVQDATAVKMLQSGKTAVAPQLLVSTGLSNPSEASSKTAVLAEMDAEKAMQPPLQHQATQQVDAAAPDDAVVAPLTSSTAAAQQGSNSEPQDSVDKAPSISSRQNLLLTSEVKSQCPQALQQHMANAALGGHAAVEQRHVVTQQNFPDLRTQHEDVRSQHEQVSSQYKQLSSQHEQLQTSHVAAVQSHQQLAVAQAARVEALTQQHSELQQAHNTNEAELWELADAHAELNSVHDASLVELQETRRQLAMLQKTFRRLTCDRQYVQNQLCSTTAELKAARQEDSAVNLQMQKLQNTEVCLRSQRDGVSAVLDHLAEVGHLLDTCAVTRYAMCLYRFRLRSFRLFMQDWQAFSTKKCSNHWILCMPECQLHHCFVDQPLLSNIFG